MTLYNDAECENLIDGTWGRSIQETYRNIIPYRQYVGGAWKRRRHFLHGADIQVFQHLDKQRSLPLPGLNHLLQFLSISMCPLRLHRL